MYDLELKQGVFTNLDILVIISKGIVNSGLLGNLALDSYILITRISGFN